MHGLVSYNVRARTPNRYMPRVLLIILSFNGLKYFDDLFASLDCVVYSKSDWEIFIIDNASSDGSAQYLREKVVSKSGVELPKVTLYESKRNTGFVGNNIGMRYALDNNFDYALLLNQDAIVDLDFIGKLVEAMGEDKKIGAAQSLIKLWPETKLINTLGNKIHFLGFGYGFGYRWTEEKALLEIRSRTEVAYPSGASLLLCVQALRDIGLLDEEFFLYHEDLDLGWRMHLRNWKVTVAPESIIYHKYEFSRSIKKYYFMERNRFIFLLKNFKIGTLFLIAPAFLIMELGTFLFSIKSGFWREKLKAYVYFLNPTKWLYILRARCQIQKTRKVSDRVMSHWLAGKIEFQDIDNPILNYLANPILNLYWRVIKNFILW